MFKQLSHLPLLLPKRTYLFLRVRISEKDQARRESSRRLSSFHKASGRDVDTVHDEQRISHPDNQIWGRLRKSCDF
jgi:hypothetical protein